MPKFLMLLAMSARLMAPADDLGGEGGGGGGAGGEEGKEKGSQAGSEGKEKDQNPGGDDFDISKLDPKVQKMIKDLRAENAKTRTDKNKVSAEVEKYKKAIKSLNPEGEEDDEEPEAKVGKLTSMAEELAVKNQLLGLAVANGISGEDYEYFEFLMQKKLESLEEGEELGEEGFEEVIEKLKKQPKQKANSSVEDKGKGGKTPEGSKGEVTLEQFNKMGMLEKSQLYNSKPEVYNALQAASRGR